MLYEHDEHEELLSEQDEGEPELVLPTVKQALAFLLLVLLFPFIFLPMLFLPWLWPWGLFVRLGNWAWPPKGVHPEL